MDLKDIMWAIEIKGRDCKVDPSSSFNGVDRVKVADLEGIYRAFFGPAYSNFFERSEQIHSSLVEGVKKGYICDVSKDWLEIRPGEYTLTPLGYEFLYGKRFEGRQRKTLPPMLEDAVFQAFNWLAGEIVAIREDKRDGSSSIQLGRLRGYTGRK